jgi:hypothetical protein
MKPVGIAVPEPRFLREIFSANLRKSGLVKLIQERELSGLWRVGECPGYHPEVSGQILQRLSERRFTFSCMG